jgi:hypothetical protein
LTKDVASAGVDVQRCGRKIAGIRRRLTPPSSGLESAHEQAGLDLGHAGLTDDERGRLVQVARRLQRPGPLRQIGAGAT